MVGPSTTATGRRRWRSGDTAAALGGGWRRAHKVGLRRRARVRDGGCCGSRRLERWRAGERPGGGASSGSETTRSGTAQSLTDGAPNACVVQARRPADRASRIGPQRPIEGGEFAHRKDGKADGETSRPDTVEDAPERCAKKPARYLGRDAVASNRAAVDAGRPRVTSATIKRLEDRIRTTWERIPREPDKVSVEAVRSPTDRGSAKGRQPVDEEHGTRIAKWLVRRAGLALVDDTRPGPARSRRKAPVCPRESVRLGDSNAGHSTPIRARGARRKAGGGGGATQTAPGAAALTERRTGTIGTPRARVGRTPARAPRARPTDHPSPTCTPSPPKPGPIDAGMVMSGRRLAVCFDGRATGAHRIGDAVIESGEGRGPGASVPVVAVSLRAMIVGRTAVAIPPRNPDRS